jgi:alkanesulfonate monooxygenase SsuD/methylene tetrahydromethanopterin reductase-like flavin-dependent oxidoreductase (luciferase family)
MLAESMKILRLLWRGEMHSYQGRHLEIAQAQLFDVPERQPLIAVAAGGPRGARLAGKLADGLFSTAPDHALVDA